MTNLEKYTDAFVKTFGIEADAAPGLRYQAIPAWDSVGHMSLVAALEEAFDLMMDTEHIIDLENYEKGMEILRDHYGVSF